MPLNSDLFSYLYYGKNLFRSGYNRWRDPMKPTQILQRLCKENKLESPHYFQVNVLYFVRIKCTNLSVQLGSRCHISLLHDFLRSGSSFVERSLDMSIP